jgi:hypothetical protein
LIPQIPQSQKKSPKNFSLKTPMEHKVTFKTKDGSLKEQRFDDFNEFADTIETLANDYYAGMKPEVSVETIYNTMVRKEKVTNEQPSESRGMEFLSEDSTETQR